MHVYPNRALWLTGLTLFLGNAGAAVTVAQDPGPRELLKSHGLKPSSRSVWILTGEAMILKDVRRARRPLACS